MNQDVVNALYSTDIKKEFKTSPYAMVPRSHPVFAQMTKNWLESLNMMHMHAYVYGSLDHDDDFYLKRERDLGPLRGERKHEMKRD